MGMAAELGILGVIALLVLALSLATGSAPAGPRRRSLARAGASAFFAFLVTFFWLAPFGERGRFLTGMAIFFAIGLAVSLWKLAASLSGRGTGEKSATH
jgi:hypothetical protein